jgi:hypothetical protein
MGGVAKGRQVVARECRGEGKVRGVLLKEVREGSCC